MTVEIVVSNRKNKLSIQIERIIRATHPKAIGIVSAFVTNGGLDTFLNIIKRHQIKEFRLVAGTDFALTHPKALSRAAELGWTVRLGRNLGGVYHPKVIIGGDAFDSDGAMLNASFIYIGSANLTKGALEFNAECGIIGRGDVDVPGSGRMFAGYWQDAVPADQRALVVRQGSSYGYISRPASAPNARILSKISTVQDY